MQDDIRNQEQVLNERAQAMQARLQQLNQQVGRVFNLVHQGNRQQDFVPLQRPGVDNPAEALRRIQDPRRNPINMPNVVPGAPEVRRAVHFPMNELDGWDGWIDELPHLNHLDYNAMPNMDNFFENEAPANRIDPVNIAPAQLALNGLGDDWFNPGVEGLVDNMPQNGHWNPYNL